MTGLVHKSAVVSGGAGNIAVVAATAGKITHVHGYVLTGTGGTESGLRFEDGNGGTALTGVMTINSGTAGDIGVPLVAPFSPVPWFSTSANTVLNLEVAGGARGHIIYSQSDA